MRFVIPAFSILLAFPVLASAQADDTGRQEMIESARRAAPYSVIEDATLMLPSGEVLVEGTNDWVCFPDDPNVPNESPMCLDEPWLEVIDAWMNDRVPQFETLGISYMLRGDMPASNVDPFASEPKPDNQWIENSGPHVMIVVPDPGLVEHLPTRPGDGPWVMWKGTPYEHVMIPVPGMPAH